MFKKPVISVLVPAYNHADYIEEMIHSVWKQKDHNIDLELIIIDDGSTDGTYQIAKQLSVQSPITMTVIVQENQGLTRTLNRALDLARGQFIAVIASDDLFATDRFTAQLELFSSNSDLVVVFGNGRNFRDDQILEQVHDAKTSQLLHSPPSTILHYLYTHVPLLLTQTCLYKHEFLKTIGGWDERMMLDDWVLNIRIFRNITQQVQYCYVDKDLIYRRLHVTNMSYDLTSHEKRIEQVIEEYIPSEFRRLIRADAYWRLGFGALITQRQLLKGIKYLFFSQFLSPNFSRLSFLIDRFFAKIRHEA